MHHLHWKLKTSLESRRAGEETPTAAAHPEVTQREKGLNLLQHNVPVEWNHPNSAGLFQHQSIIQYQRRKKGALEHFSRLTMLKLLPHCVLLFGNKLGPHYLNQKGLRPEISGYKGGSTSHIFQGHFPHSCPFACAIDSCFVAMAERQEAAITVN